MDVLVLVPEIPVFKERFELVSPPGVSICGPQGEGIRDFIGLAVIGREVAVVVAVLFSEGLMDRVDVEAPALVAVVAMEKEELFPVFKILGSVGELGEGRVPAEGVFFHPASSSSFASSISFFACVSLLP